MVRIRTFQARGRHSIRHYGIYLLIFAFHPFHVVPRLWHFCFRDFTNTTKLIKGGTISNRLHLAAETRSIVPPFGFHIFFSFIIGHLVPSPVIYLDMIYQILRHEDERTNSQRLFVLFVCYIALHRGEHLWFI